MSMLKHALEYAARGWAVLPLHSIELGECTCGNSVCKSPGKHPLIYGGSKEATTNCFVIETWWQHHPNANIGIATGSISGIFVIDVDYGPEKNGYLSLESLEAANGNIPRTSCVRTGSGGLHIYLLTPQQLIKNSASKLATHIDVRGDGGYVVAPPSRHISGNLYKWENSYAA
jgi:hypothetical protein